MSFMPFDLVATIVWRCLRPAELDPPLQHEAVRRLRQVAAVSRSFRAASAPVLQQLFALQGRTRCHGCGRAICSACVTSCCGEHRLSGSCTPCCLHPRRQVLMDAETRRFCRACFPGGTCYSCGAAVCRNGESKMKRCQTCTDSFCSACFKMADAVCIRPRCRPQYQTPTGRLGYISTKRPGGPGSCARERGPRTSTNQRLPP